MQRNRLVVIGAILILVVLGVSYIATYNNLVSLNQKVESQWATVQVEYQRRVDLIPNLVNAVKGYQQFEAGLLTNITALRSAWISANTSADRIQYGTALDSALGRLLVVYENYPQLQSVTVVAGLMDELAGTENRIAVERMRYNLAVQDFNTAIHSFPTSLVAGSLGYSDRPYFNSQLNASSVPTVQIGT